MLRKKYRCNTRTIFSGRGFQVLIPYEQLQLYKNESFIEKDEQMNIYKKYMKIAQQIHEKYTEVLDLVGYDSMKICKVPNSMVVNTKKSKDIYMAKIMTDDMLKNFDIKMVRYDG